MKKILFLIVTLFVVSGFALTDTDADGVTDERDVCPRVYSRSETGCPRLAAVSTPVQFNSCITQASKDTIILTITPVCREGVCPKIQSVSGVQQCDPIFPVIFDTSGAVIIRGGVYIVGFTR